MDLPDPRVRATSQVPDFPEPARDTDSDAGRSRPVAGILYGSEPVDRDRSASGREKWVFDPKVALEPFGQYKCRGVSLWHDVDEASDTACAWRIFTSTSDRRLIAVDARTGKSCAGFGVDGQVDLNPLIASAKPAGDIKGVQLWSPPAVIGDIVAVSSSVHSKSHLARSASGQIRGFDARSGKLQWVFDPIPRNLGDPEAKNWTKEALENTGAANVWSFMSVDAGRDLLFLPTASASPDYFGGTRPGDNRYATSLVVLKGSTGELVWHFQTTITTYGTMILRHSRFWQRSRVIKKNFRWPYK